MSVSIDGMHIPNDVLNMIILKPIFEFENPPAQEFNFTFGLNAILWDVYHKVRKFGDAYEILDSKQRAVDMNQYLLEYMANNESVICIRKRSAEEAFRLQEPPMLFLQSAHRKMPLEMLNRSTLYLDPVDFLRELSQRMAAVGYSTRLQAFNTDFDELTENYKTVIQWLRHSSRHDRFILVPLGNQGNRITPASISTPYRTSSSVSGSANNAANNVIQPSSTTTTIPIPTPRPTPTTLNAPHTRSNILPGEQSFNNKKQELRISLKPGISIDLASDRYTVRPDGLTFDEEVATALAEFGHIVSPGVSKSSNFDSQSHSDDSELGNARLGYELRRRLVGTRLGNEWQSIPDDWVAQNAINRLKTDIPSDAVVIHRIIRECLDLRAKVRRHEANQANRYAFVQNSLVRISAGLKFTWHYTVIAAKYFWWAFNQEITLICLYSLFWLYTFRVISDRNPLKNPMKYFLLCYLTFNVFYTIGLTRFNYDFFTLIQRRFPRVYPDDIVSALGRDAIHAAARESVRGADLNYIAIVDSAIIRPSIFQIVMISVLSVVPSLLGTWHDTVDKRRHKAIDDIKAAVEQEQSKINREVAANNEHQEVPVAHTSETNQ